MWTFIEFLSKTVLGRSKTKFLGNINHSSINYWFGGCICIVCLIYPMDNLDRKGNNMKRERRQRKFGETSMLFFYQAPQSYQPFL